MPKLFQYQSKFEPIVPPTATGIFSQNQIVFVVPRTTQYQRLAYVPVVAVQQIWVDKWLTQIWEPIPKPFNRAHYSTTELVLPPSLRPETVSIDRWHAPVSQPQFVSKRQQFTYGSSFLAPLASTEQSSVDKWFSPTQQPVLRTPPRSYITPIELVLADTQRPEAVSIDKWHQNTNQPRLDRRRQQQTFPSTFYTPLLNAEQISADKWFVPTQQPLFKPSQRAYITPLELILTNTQRPEAVSLDKWHQNIQQPRFDKKLGFVFGSTFFTPVVSPTESVTMDKWNADTSRPTPRRTQFTFGQTQWTPLVTTTPETVTPDKWFSETSRPTIYRKYQHLLPSFFFHPYPIPTVTPLDISGVQATPIYYTAHLQYQSMSFVPVVHICPRERTVYGNKYSTRSSSYGNKYSSRGSAYGNKYSTRGTTYSDKYIQPC